MWVQHGFKHRPLRDGGGKPSPGRWCPADRPTNEVSAKGQQILSMVGKADVMKTALARIKEGDKQHPFEDTLLHQIRCILGPAHLHGVEPGQPFHLELISYLAKQAGDPDWRWPLICKHGVPLGVDEPALDTPGVWPTKTELRGQEYEDDGYIPEPRGRDNYMSAEKHANTIEETFWEEKDLGMVEGPFDAAEAAKVCGCSVQDLCTGALGAVEESDKVRTIFDGTVIFVNEWIRRLCREKTTAPTLADALQALHWLTSFGQGALANSSDKPLPQRYVLLKADVSKAHRRVKIQRKDWKYQIAKINGKYWVNKVGTYGVASAQLYWGRSAALKLRLLYYLFVVLPWGFVYVDDFAFILNETSCFQLSMALLVTLIAMGCPLSWHKTALGDLNVWLGFQINTFMMTSMMAPAKHSVVQEMLSLLVSGAPITFKQLESLLGRLVWATSACPMMKPFLQPFWAMKAQIQTSGRPGLLVRMISKALMHVLSTQTTAVSPYGDSSSWTGASDAGASDSHATVGGWFSDKPHPEKHEVFWFLVDMDPATHPWAFDKGDPKLRIAAMELFGSLLLFRHLVQRQETATKAALYVPLLTDNMGNVYSVLNARTKEWPCSAIMMELISEAHLSAVFPDIRHVRREFNTWADDLTNHRTQGFDACKQVTAIDRAKPWRLLPELFDVFYANKTSKPSFVFS